VAGSARGGARRVSASNGANEASPAAAMQVRLERVMSPQAGPDVVGRGGI